MKLRILSLRTAHLFVLVTAVLFSFSCKKKKEFNNETAQATVDVRMALGEMDEVLKDINTVMMERYPLRGRLSGVTGTTSVCGVTLDSLGELTGKMTMNYNGTDCYGRTRTGTVKFTIEDYPLRKWKQKGCVVHIEFINYQSTRSNGSFVRLAGSQKLVNETGNSWFELWYMSSAPVTYLHSGQNMRVTYTGDNTANISVNRRLTFSYASGITSCLAEGLDNQQGRSRVEAWGQDIEGENFAAEVTTPYTWKTDCGAVAPVKGAVTVVLEGKEYDLDCRFGLDRDGNQVAENGTCPFGWEVTWSRKKRTNSRLFSYY